MSIREELNQWMLENLTGEFEQIRWRGGPGDEDSSPELRRAWEKKFGEAGWIGLQWPKEYGGRDLSLMDFVEFNEEYARHGGPGRAGHIGETLMAPTILAYGTQAQKERFLPGIKNGTELWCQGYSEPNAGSDLSNIKTKARLVDGHWVIDGQKIWTSLAHESDWIFVLARAEEGTKGRNGLVFLLVELDQPGIDIRPIHQISGTAEFNEVYFTEAKTEADNIIGEVGEGWKIAMALLGFERGASTLGQQMMFQNELNLIIKTANKNGRANDPSLRRRIAEAHAGLKVMRFNALRMLNGTQDGSTSKEGYISKIFWATWHRDLGELAMDVIGADAEIIEDELSPLQKLFLFSRADTIYAGTNQIQRNIISERALGMPKEPRGNTNG
ncbi:MAG: acyl-CoA dehydrogenase family protein [Pseudomonadota bacterium]|nr:acyl-CoA dehydrogenase family protein [Pseudomonadota bacterium]